jgi:hypothetical protein
VPTALFAPSLAQAAIAERNLGWEGLNAYADLTPEEFNVRNGLIPSTTHGTGVRPLHKLSGKTPPSAVDWRDPSMNPLNETLVNPVKNQGQCGSCWAFSTVVSTEGAHAKTTGKLVSLSEQNIVDCAKGVIMPDNSTCCNGCQGGLMDAAFTYLENSQKGELDTEAGYPYKGAMMPCTFSESDVGATIKSHVDVKSTDEDALLDAVATIGPISVAVDAGIGWQLYSGGVMKGLLCSSDPKKLDHGVAVVGYGTDGSDDYWTIRNSWGATWGEGGYVRLIRGKNACGLADQPSYPIASA